MTIARAVKNVFLVAGKRTPFGAYGGSLSKYTATDLQEIASKAAIEASGVPAEAINQIYIGNVAATSRDGAYIARHVGLRIGMKIESPALVVNRLCGSGFQTVINAAQDINVGDSEIVMTGGAENMSQSPHVIRGARFGIALGKDLPMEDSLWHTLIDYGCNTPMGVTAENLAKKYGITREECDKFSFETMQRWKKAHESGYFKEEMVPITVKTKKGPKVIDRDEHPRPDSTIETFSKLPPVFSKDGVITAANASGICDGAAAVIVASEEACKKHNLEPLARLAGYGISGCEPTVMGIGPVPAIRGLMKATGQNIKEVDLVDINEAFAPQILACMKELELDPSRLNVNGGAISLGHPVGASGSRIVAHLIHEMRRTGAKNSVGAACIGGGQGISVLLEKC